MGSPVPEIKIYKEAHYRTKFVRDYFTHLLKARVTENKYLGRNE